MQLAWSTSLRNPNRAVFLIGLAAVTGIGGWKLLPLLSSWVIPNGPGTLQSPPAAAAVQVQAEERDKSDAIVFAQDSWKAAGLELRPVQTAAFTEPVELTGKVTLNEDRVTHIFPLVDGRVDEVRIRFGQKVRKGELLLVVQSKEVGQAKLKLSQNRLQLGFAVTRDKWIQEVAENTKLLLKLIQQKATIEEIEVQLKDRPLGEYRDRLMSAYIQNYKSEMHLERLSPLSKEGVVAGKQLLEAESEWKASRATLQSLVEQIQQDAQQAAIVSSQTVKELQTNVSVDETSLKILGFESKDLENVDPEKEGEAIAHYPICAPFDGTVISKDAVLFERVGPERQILSVADLSTVWITTDIYEEHLRLLNQLEGQTIYLHSNAWPDKKFEATIFYTGDVVNEASRTVSMRALADNKDGFLKPGMFVTVEFPNVSKSDVIQVPGGSVLDHEGQSFVFVHLEGDMFERRDVTLGRHNDTSVEIVAGLNPKDVIVVKGGFALKSQMLSELLAE